MLHFEQLSHETLYQFNWDSTWDPNPAFFFLFMFTVTRYLPDGKGKMSCPGARLQLEGDAATTVCASGSLLFGGLPLPLLGFGCVVESGDKVAEEKNKKMRKVLSNRF